LPRTVAAYFLPTLLSADGGVTTLAGNTASFADGVGTAARFSNMYDVSVRESTGAVYVADSYNYRVRVISPGATLASQGMTVVAFLLCGEITA
jgi:ABC-type Co2+ transport system permease subunit